MHYRRLGRTGLKVSVLSLGTGGANRLGQSRHVSREQVRRLIDRALDLGVNLFDTSGAYENSESLLGDALRGVPRERYFLSSKIFPWQGQHLFTPLEIRRGVEHSLRRLQVHEIDLFHLHRVTPDQYEEVRDRVLPELEKLRQEGKIRFVGISESSSRDAGHRVLQSALRDDLYDTIMVAYHPANSSARQMLFPRAQQQDVGIICMAVARQFVPRSLPDRLRLLGSTVAGLFTSPPASFSRFRARIQDAFQDAVRPGEAWPSKGNVDATLGGLGQLPEAAYAYALLPDAVASVLTGTTNVAHLESNVAAVLSLQS